MAASYPSSLPVKNAAGANLSTDPHSALHDGMYDEIVAIATELGTNPKGTSASVKAKLDVVEVGAWTSWTPTISQSTSVTVTNTRSRYVRIGRTIIASFKLSVTGTGTASNAIVLGGLPATAAYAGNLPIGVVTLSDSSSGVIYGGRIILATTTSCAFWTSSADQSAVELGNQVFTAALANSDGIEGTITYEAAS